MSDKSKMLSLIEQLGKAFAELESHNNSLDEKILYKEIEEHFRHLDAEMEMKSSQIELMEKAFREEESYFTSLLAQREATVAIKEQDMLDQIQELKDAAVADIIQARSHHEIPNPEPSKVSISLIRDKNLPCTVPIADVAVRPDLTQLCERMDAKGLVNLILNNRNNETLIRDELMLALQRAAEPDRLVLDLVEGFRGKNDENTLGGILLVLEAMAANEEVVSGDIIKRRAKAVADEWKPKLANDENALLAFLQLISTFRVASEFDDEELCKFVLAASKHRQVPALCRFLGLDDKIPGIVDVLNRTGKQIYAVHFIHEFQLTETYPIALLLRTYLKDLRRNSQGKGNKYGTNANSGANDANAQELAAVKAVIQCIQEYKLESEYPLDPLQRRAAQLDRAVKPDRKRVFETVKPQQFKKPRANGAAPCQLPAPAPAPAQTVYGERYPVSGVYGYQGAPAVQQGYDQRSYYHPPPPQYNPHQPYL